MKRILLPVLFSLTLLSVTGQSNLQAGWILPNTGDTVKGMVNYRPWSVTPSTIEFHTEKVTVYGVTDLKAFGIVNGQTYRRFNISYHPIPINDIMLFPENEEALTISTAWLKILVQSTYSLAEFSTKERPYFFIIENDQPKELVYYTGIRAVQQSRSVEVKTYINELIIAAEKSGTGVAVPVLLRYNTNDLHAFFLKLNGITGQVHHSTRAAWGIKAGMGYYSFSFNGINPTKVFSGTAKSSVSPLAGATLSFLPARNTAKIGVILDAVLTNITSSATSVPYIDYVSSTRFNSYYLDLSGSPIYIFNPGNMSRLYAGLGLRVMVPIASTNTTIETQTIPGASTEQKGEPKPATVLTGKIMAGWMSGNINVSLSYSPPAYMTAQSANYQLKADNVSIGISFMFNSR